MNQQGQWQVAGSAPKVYERELVPAVFGVWAPILVELAHPRPGERVVDVACGTGIVARIAAARVGLTGSVVGVDLNRGMLSVARSIVSPGPRSCAPHLGCPMPTNWRPSFAPPVFRMLQFNSGLGWFAFRPSRGLC